MKYFLILFLMLGSLNLAAKSKAGYIQFAKTTFSFGTFDKRTVRKCVFIFTNTGNAPVIINEANATCNCTSASFTKTPVLPGKKGYVTIYYNGNNYNKGYFKKNVDVHSNAENGLTRLFISGTTK